MRTATPKQHDSSPRRKKVLHRLVENKLFRKLSYNELRDKVRDKYDGPQGALLSACSMISLHLPLGERLLKKRQFDVRGMRNMLDIGTGAGQIAQHLLKYADGEAALTCIDLSSEMLRRARNRLKNPKPRYVVADLASLPFPDNTFDGVTCGYVLEHLPDPRPGLSEILRVMRPGGRMMLLTSEDTFSGAWTSRMWCCRTYNRHELRTITDEIGLCWHKDLWFSGFHKLFRAGGICVELRKPVE